MKGRTKNIVLALLIFLLALCSQVFASPHTIYGDPIGKQNNTVITRNIYTLSNNPQTKFADWVAYKVSPSTLGTANTSRNWKTDPTLPSSETLEPQDYKDANRVLKTDRGHQAPLASFKGTSYWSETNYLSNITPQKSALNQGPWRFLEEYTRDLARMGNEVYVITGPLYEREMPDLPGCDENHKLPSGYWKILSLKQGNAWKFLAFAMDQNTPRGAEWDYYQVTIDAIEGACNLDFFNELPDEIENKIEASISPLIKISKNNFVTLNQAITKTAPSSKSRATVYVTSSGGKYHNSGCRYLRKSKISISLEDAKKAGYEPCKVCKPPK
jgi:endonuclease G